MHFVMSCFAGGLLNFYTHAHTHLQCFIRGGPKSMAAEFFYRNFTGS